jgi:hypothetical protein
LHQVPSHEAWVLQTDAKGKRRGQRVRQADVDEIRARVDLYRDMRAVLTRLEAIGKEENALLRRLVKQRHVPYD